MLHERAQTQQVWDLAQDPRTADTLERMSRAIRYIALNWADQPSLDQIAAHAGLSPTYFQRVFARHVGLSPKRFMGYLSLNAAKHAINDGAPLLEAAFEAGLSGPGRLHDLFVTYDAVSPGEHKQAGDNVDLAYGFHPTLFGLCLIVVSARGIVGIAFADRAARAGHAPGPTAGEGDDLWAPDAALADMKKRFPKARFHETPQKTAPIAQRLFDVSAGTEERPVPLHLTGTNFQVRVWEALLNIPPGLTVTYGDLATMIGAPAATRAVSTAVGRNPISYLIPCHRVVRRDGGLGGYHWGLSTKRALLAWEQANGDNQGR